MCAGPFRPKAPPPPPPPVEEESVRQQRLRMRKQQDLKEKAKRKSNLKKELLHYSGRRGRRSLLTGRRGGQGFEIAADLMSKIL